MDHIHLIGIGGTGLSAIARVLLESGYTVSGSDMQDSPLAQAVRDAGAQVFIGHAPENIAGADLVVRSSAIPERNPEVQAALQAGIPVFKRADFLGRLLQNHQGIAVAGTHGKTTTTAMLAWMLTALGQDPSFIVGGVVNNLETNAHAGTGEIFAIEADEYDRTFLGLQPQMAIITNVEHDHPDIYPSPEEFRDAFRDFVRRLTPEGILLLCADDPGALDLMPVARQQNLRTFTYAIQAAAAEYRAENLRPIPGKGYAFDAVIHARKPAARCSFSLQVPGRHNVLNALAALGIADQLNLPLDAAAQALSEFRGAGRRFDLLGEAGGVAVIDDYGHHPTEIQATLQAAAARYPGRPLWAIWQPHTYSRTQMLFDDFAASFVDADHVVVTEVYRSREPIDPDFSPQKLVEAIRHRDAHFIPDLTDVTAFLLARLQPGDVLLVFSAGDANQISRQVYESLRERSLISGRA